MTGVLGRREDYSLELPVVEYGLPEHLGWCIRHAEPRGEQFSIGQNAQMISSRWVAQIK